MAAAKAFGDIDFLILNGDLPDHSGDIKNFTAIHRIVAEITDGEKPVVFSCGNNGMRGIYAENIEEHTPTDKGNSYYTFRLGSIWGMVLDCGEVYLTLLFSKKTSLRLISRKKRIQNGVDYSENI